MNKLARELAARIERSGPITVEAWMQACISHYFGAEGDFITAPEISQIFGELIGAWLADQWQRLGSPARACLCELGPGRGTLMRDALRATRGVPGFHAALQIHLVETSPSLQAVQKRALDASHPVLRWHEDMSTLPDLPLLLVANECFDALPIRQFVGDAERCVEWAGDAFRFMPEGKVTREDSPASLAMLQAIAGHVRAYGGAALIIDYGYDGEGGQDTLQAVARHAYADPLVTSGDIDLTAHVDFAALKQAADGVNVWGTVPQGVFLKRLGAELRALSLCRSATPEQQQAILSGLERLASPEQMGELFKVLALTSTQGMPAGFLSGQAIEKTI
jgi:NADH dehydrogenase [ubiquinone] 1 alpha subcomplex assembly factor 7